MLSVSELILIFSQCILLCRHYGPSDAFRHPEKRYYHRKDIVFHTQDINLIRCSWGKRGMVTWSPLRMSASLHLSIAVATSPMGADLEITLDQDEFDISAASNRIWTDLQIVHMEFLNCAFRSLRLKWRAKFSLEVQNLMFKRRKMTILNNSHYSSYMYYPSSALFALVGIDKSHDSATIQLQILAVMPSTTSLLFLSNQLTFASKFIP